MILSRLLELLAADAGPIPDEVALRPPALDDTIVSIPPIPEGLAGSDLLGQAHEALLDRAHRRHKGVFYTPAAIAAGLAESALRHTHPNGEGGPPRVCDPAVGGGAFLLAAARALEGRGFDRAEIVDRCLWGIDIDPLAVSVTRAALWLWSAESGAPTYCPHLAIGDSLHDGERWPDTPPHGFDVVVGNPPFQSQLGGATARTPQEADVLRERLGFAVHGYVDTSALFLLAALDMAAPGGSVALVQPQSVLAARDARGVREALRERASLREIWIDDRSAFDAQVRVCAPVFELSDLDRWGDVRRTVGERFEPAPPRRLDGNRDRAGGSWAPLLSDLMGVPTVELASAQGTLGSIADATAGFRDQYYGIIPFVHEAPRSSFDGSHQARLVTSGSIDPAVCTWGSRPARFAGRSWQAPVVDLDRLHTVPALARWADERLVPKVVVATQTRIIEAAVDVDGSWWPSVPTIAVTPRPESELWEVAAVVMAPPVSAWAFARFGGTALSMHAVKLAARQVGEIPLPTDRDAWCEATPLLREATGARDASEWTDALGRFGRVMCAAYAVGDDVFDWWFSRLPRWRVPPPAGVAARPPR